MWPIKIPEKSLGFFGFRKRQQIKQGQLVPAQLVFYHEAWYEGAGLFSPHVSPLPSSNLCENYGSKIFQPNWKSYTYRREIWRMVYQK